MSENIIDSTVAPNSESISTLGSPIVPSPKKFPLFLAFLLILLTTFAVISVYLFIQVRTLTLEKNSPSPTPTPSPSADPTKMWPGYSNQLFSFRHPQEVSITTNTPLNSDPEFNLVLTEKNDKILANLLIHAKNYQYRVDNAKAHELSLSEWLSWNLYGNCQPHKVGEIEGQLCHENPYGSDKYIFITKSNGRFVQLIGENSSSQILDQILSTFKFTDKVSNSQKATFSGTLQTYLQSNCEKGNPYSIDLSKLPVKLDSQVITTSLRPDGIVAFCSSTSPDSLSEAWVAINLVDNSSIGIYDKASNELGHGGPPFIGSFGEAIYQKDNVKITAYLAYGEGPALLGELGVVLRGQKEFTTQTGELYYANFTLTGIPGDDSRLISYLQPYSHDEGFDAPVVDSSKFDSPSLIKHFFKSVQPNTPESRALAKVKIILDGITSK